MNLSITKRLFKKYAWSIALYNCETWTINKIERKALESFEMWSCRPMQKVSWMERKSNQDVMEIVGEERS